MTIPGKDRTDDRRPDLDRQLRACIACGLCLPSCATYLVTGSEAQSPRGRLQLLAGVVAGRFEAGDPAVAQAFALCLGCRACTEACPSGVSPDLLDHLRALGDEAASRHPAVDRLTRLARSAGGRLGRAPSRLARLLGAAGVGPQSDTDLRQWLDDLVARAPSHQLPRTAPGAGRRPDRRTLPAGPLPAGGAFGRLRELLVAHGAAFDPEPAGGADSAAWPSTVYDLLDDLLPPRLGEVPLRAVLHRPCPASGSSPDPATTVRLLARAIGLEVRQAQEQDVCCGGVAGYEAKHPQVSRLMGRRKAGILGEARCDVAVTTCPDCFGQIAGAMAAVPEPVPVLMLSDLLWYAWKASCPGIP